MRSQKVLNIFGYKNESDLLTILNVLIPNIRQCKDESSDASSRSLKYLKMEKRIVYMDCKTVLELSTPKVVIRNILECKE